MKQCKHFLVSGRVQGVFYRASTCRQARECGLVGWVRNLADGCVEVLACGAEADLQQLEGWLWRGPELAQVSNVQVNARDYQDFDQFEVRE